MCGEQGFFCAERQLKNREMQMGVKEKEAPRVGPSLQNAEAVTLLICDGFTLSLLVNDRHLQPYCVKFRDGGDITRISACEVRAI